jgi:hypothetical protein
MITFAQVQAEVRALAAASPDYVYTSGTNDCFYTAGADGNETGECCIFGQALTRLGVPVEDLAAREGDGINGLFEGLGIFATVREEDWARRVQSRQDWGYTWAAAIEHGDTGRH